MRRAQIIRSVACVFVSSNEYYELSTWRGDAEPGRSRHERQLAPRVRHESGGQPRPVDQLGAQPRGVQLGRYERGHHGAMLAPITQFIERSALTQPFEAGLPHKVGTVNAIRGVLFWPRLDEPVPPCTPPSSRREPSPSIGPKGPSYRRPERSRCSISRCAVRPMSPRSRSLSHGSGAWLTQHSVP